MRLPVCFLLVLLSACNAKWETLDVDGDGVTVAAGDCWEGEGGENVFPGAAEIWYDGIDEDCNGGSDYDADGDGHDASAVAQPDGTVGDDCWDQPGSYPEGFVAVAGSVQLEPAEVYPGAAEAWYDGIDGDCSGGTDFDQDADGYDDANHPQVDGHTGDDCYDAVDAGCVLLDGSEPDCTYPLSGPLVGAPFAPEDIGPDEVDVAYDGTDQDCGGNSDYDADGDGFDRADECNDADAAIYPNPDIPQVWYNGIDENCTGNDGDQDGDGYYIAEYPYPELIPADYLDYTGDCWDDPADAAAWHAINGFSDPADDHVHPGAYDEWYDGLDANCAGDDDFDADADSHTSDAWADTSGAYGDDCDDARADMYPGAVDIWYDGDDSDCAGNDDFDQDYDGYESDGFGGGDCDDANVAVHPERDELCTTIDDDNCDGNTNDIGATGCALFYSDLDGDSHGGPADECLCIAEGAYVFATSDDCDDANSAAYPGAPETVGDNVDEDCNSGEICFVDVDNDTYRTTTGSTIPSVDADCLDAGEAVSSDPATDCNDVDPAINPAATELTGDNVDQNCDRSETCYVDSDNDTYRTTTGSTTVSADADCNDAGEAVATEPATDCNDSSAAINPAAAELTGDNVDQNCDAQETCYVDADNDAYRTTTGSTVVSTANTNCTDAGEAVATDPATDCNDGNAAINPAATELTGDNVDQNCDTTETCYVDVDNDNYRTTTGSTVVSSDADCTDSGESVATDPATDCNDGSSSIHPGATETVGDSVDENCDGGETCYVDVDNDNYRTTSGSTVSSADADCTDAGEAVSTDPATDCNDAEVTIHPGATEVVGDGIDQTCDGGETCYVDADNDNYRNTTGTTVSSTDADCTDSGEAVASDPATDCNDSSATVHPGATETVGNSIDENCDGAETCYVDVDNDNYRTTSGSTVASVDSDCTDSGEALATDPATDCNDAVSTINPGASETVGDGIDQTCDGAETCYVDADNDNYRTTTGSTVASIDADCTDSGEALSSDPATDCNDASASIKPGAAETVADGIDQDCDSVDSCYTDVDNDNYGTAVVVDGSSLNCVGGTGAAVSTDCNDGSSAVHPGATELTADGVDQDCDAVDACYTDSDNDNYGTAVVVDGSSLNCVTGTGAAVSTDCNDGSASINPGVAETVADGVDQDCDSVDSCYTDTDNDNYGTAVVVDGSSLNCATGTGATVSTDCNDGSASVHPGASEVTADGIDQDCDSVDACFTDTDNDNYGTTVVMDGSTLNCTTGTGAPVSTDCNDGNAAINPGVSEIVADGVDQDCDSVDSCYTDTDGDNYGTSVVVDGSTLNCTSGTGAPVNGDCDDATVYVKPGALELCDGLKNDCGDAGWTTAYEDGTASSNANGTWTDITASVLGAAGASVAYTLPTSSTTTVWFCPGTFYVNLSATNSNSTVAGRGAATDIILDADAAGPVLDATGSSSSVLTMNDLTFTNGVGKDVAGTSYGGAIYATSGSAHGSSTTMVILNRAVIFNNVADNGGGIALDNRGSITLNNSKVYENSALTNGGGLWTSQGEAVCTGGSGTYGVYFNDAVGKGGGAFLANSNNALLDSNNCDWGETIGTDENVIGAVANDVDVTHTGGGAVNSYDAYGVNETFSCMGGGGGGGTCAP